MLNTFSLIGKFSEAYAFLNLIVDIMPFILLFLFLLAFVWNVVVSFR